MILLLFLSTVILPAMNGLQVNNQKQTPCTGIEISIESLKWDHRVLVIFSNDSESEAYRAQIEEFTGNSAGFDDRDLVQFSIFKNGCSLFENQTISDESATGIRKYVEPDEDEFSIYLIGKDGGIKLSQSELLTTETLFRVIDRMPMRQREMRQDGG